MTSAENALKQILEGLGYVTKIYSARFPTDRANTIYMQVPVHKFRLDFALINAKICLEADGEWWHSGFKKFNDRNRDAILRNLGWRTLRFQSTVLEKYPVVAEKQVRQGIDVFMDL